MFEEVGEAGLGLGLRLVWEVGLKGSRTEGFAMMAEWECCFVCLCLFES